MNCQDARELFSARVDEALSAEECVELEAHLAGCAECRRELARFESTVALLHAVVPARAPVGFVDRVLAAARPARWPERLRRRLVQPLAWGQPIAATVGVLMALTAVYLYQKSPELQQAARPTVSYPAASQAAKEETAEKRAKTAPARAPAGRDVSREVPESRIEASRDAPGVVAKKEAELGDKTRQVERYAAATDETGPARPAESAAPSGGRPVASPPAAEGPAPAARSPVPPITRERQADARGDVETRTFGRTGAENLAAKAVAVDVAGRLAVVDRRAAERALGELLARLGAVEVARYAEADTLVVEVVVPGRAYVQLAEGLARIGRWQPERVPSELPPQVRVSVRVLDRPD